MNQQQNKHVAHSQRLRLAAVSCPDRLARPILVIVNTKIDGQERLSMKMAIGILVACAAAPIPAYAQHSIELNASVGYTNVDIDAVVEKDEVTGAEARDWGFANWGVGAQYFYLTKLDIGVGAELMYQHLYWYEVKVPYGRESIYREYAIDAVRIAPLVRFLASGPVSFDVGPELNFMDELRFGAMISGNLNITLGEHWVIPLKLRLDVFKDIEWVAPLSASVGVRFKT